MKNALLIGYDSTMAAEARGADNKLKNNVRAGSFCIIDGNAPFSPWFDFPSIHHLNTSHGSVGQSLGF